MEKLINISSEIMWGTPVFAHTRVPVKALFDYLRHGHSIEAFVDDFPTVKLEQVIQLLDDVDSHLTSTVSANESSSR